MDTLHSVILGDRHRFQGPRQVAWNVKLFALVWLVLSPCVFAQEPERDTAFVEIDGEKLFQVRGIEAIPAAARAGRIAENIKALARDRTFRPETLRVEKLSTHTNILNGSTPVMAVTDPDAEIEGLDRSLLVDTYNDRIRRAVVEYRQARTSATLAASAGRAALGIVIAAAVLGLVLWLLRRGEAACDRGFHRQAGTLGTHTRLILRVEVIWKSLRGVFRGVRVAAILGVALFLLQYLLIQFPWTRAAGLRLFESISAPVDAVVQSIVATIPNLVFLAIIFLITRYALSIAKVYFNAVQTGRIRLQNFEPEWAHPTYNLVRLFAIGFALVIAYPLIPGSDSAAFKGLSILAGVMFSLSSSSAIANAIAGYMLIFRRAFRVGDRVKIGNVQGVVTDMRLQATHVRTIKNEIVTIPNAVILGIEVTNYSEPARQSKLILHTEIGIGYEVPWRQVEAMLIAAANRTSNLLQDPPPFVLQLKLGDFSITYQINAYCDRSEGIPLILAELHRNILDEFNEHGVQIMTPSYEGDPEAPKIVAKEDWFASPALAERERSLPSNSPPRLESVTRRAGAAPKKQA